MRFPRAFILSVLCLLCITATAHARTITDAHNRQLEIPDTVTRVICSGPGCLRLLTYLQAQDMIVAVDDIEKRRSQFDARPYALANPQFANYPVFGEFRGHDNPERIASLEPQPQVIFKTYSTMGHDPAELQAKTGIPVIILEYGDLGKAREQFFQALRIMGKTIGKADRAEDVIDYFTESIRDMEQRVADIPQNKRPSAFIGGVAFKGPHGYQSTEPSYPPFTMAGAQNVAAVKVHGKQLKHSDIAKEKLLEWDPQFLFLDLSTTQLGSKASGLYELRHDPVYQALTGVAEDHVYGLLPYNWYTQNYGSVLANAYYIGTLLHPERFRGIDPKAKADEIYTFLVGKPVFKEMDANFGNMAFERIPLK